MTPRVLHAAAPTDGGVARYVADLAAEQARRGWTVVVATGRSGPLARWLDGTGVEHRVWSTRRGLGPGVAAEARRFARIVAATRPDVVHLHSSKAGLAGRLVDVPAVRIFQPHGWSFLALSGPARALAGGWERLAARRTDPVLCVSEAERDALPTARSPRGRVVHTGVDLARYTPAPAGPARAALGLGPGPVAVCVARLCRQKGQDRLLAVWPAVRARVPDATLVLVGDGPARPALAAAAATAGGVGFAGRVDDVRPWLHAADVVVLPSRWEALPLAVLEAMACGRPVVACDVGGVREAVGPDTGAVVAPADGAGLADAVAVRLLDPDRVAAEGRCARFRAERCFDLDRCLAEVCALTLDTLAGAA